MANGDDKAKKGPGGLATSYLVAYNVVLALGWLQVTVLALLALLSPEGYRGVWDDVEWPLKIWQTAAVLEIVHVATGVVRSQLSTTVIQVFSRLIVLWAVCDAYPEVPLHWSFSTMVLSWGVTEIVRYTNYATELLNLRPYALLWMRYTFFFLLYPTGAGSEMLQTYTALPFVPSVPLYCFFVALLAAYVPLFPVQYLHMISQRGKQLSPKKDKQAKAQ